MFHILNLETGKLLMKSDDEPLSFETGQQASEYCKRQQDYYGNRFQPRKAGTNKTWRKREQKRIDDGTYKRPTYLALLEADPDHFLHLCGKDDGRLAYTKDTAKGSADIQTRIALQGYIETYRKDLSGSELKALREAHERETLEYTSLKFATTPDEIEGVYTNYAHLDLEGIDGNSPWYSCMRYSKEHFRTPVHPAAIYGAGDLAIAYLTDDDGATIARALCWPEKKIYGRVYDTCDRLHRYLKARGFKQSSYYDRVNESLAGARLLRIEHPDDDSVFVMPYIDEPLGVVTSGKFLKLSERGYSDDISTGNTHGWSGDARERMECESCGDELDDDDYVIVRASQFETARWCQNCAENNAFYSGYSGNYFAYDGFDTVDVDGQTWALHEAESRAVRLDRPAGVFTRRDYVRVIVDEAGTQQTWSKDEAEGETWIDEGNVDFRVLNSIKPVVVVAGDWSAFGNNVANERTENWSPVSARRYAFKSDFDGKAYSAHLFRRVVLPDRRVVAHTQESEAREAWSMPTVVAQDATPRAFKIGDVVCVGEKGVGYSYLEGFVAPGRVVHSSGDSDPIVAVEDLTGKRFSAYAWRFALISEAGVIFKLGDWVRVKDKPGKIGTVFRMPEVQHCKYLVRYDDPEIGWTDPARGQGSYWWASLEMLTHAPQELSGQYAVGDLVRVADHSSNHGRVGTIFGQGSYHDELVVHFDVPNVGWTDERHPGPGSYWYVNVANLEWANRPDALAAE